MANSLDTGIKLVKNVGRFNFGAGSLAEAEGHIGIRRRVAREAGADGRVLFLVDRFFESQPNVVARLRVQDGDRVLFVDTKDEPDTDGIDSLHADVLAGGFSAPAAIVAMGGGITMDTAKALANLLTNGGKAAS